MAPHRRADALIISGILIALLGLGIGNPWLALAGCGVAALGIARGPQP